MIGRRDVRIELPGASQPPTPVEIQVLGAALESPRWIELRSARSSVVVTEDPVSSGHFRSPAQHSGLLEVHSWSPGRGPLILATIEHDSRAPILHRIESPPESELGVELELGGVVPPDAVLSWASEQPRKPRLHVIQGAGHFFHGKLHELKPLILDFLR